MHLLMLQNHFCAYNIGKILQVQVGMTRNNQIENIVVHYSIISNITR